MDGISSIENMNNINNLSKLHKLRTIIVVLISLISGFLLSQAIPQLNMIEKPLSLGITGSAVAPSYNIAPADITILPDMIIIKLSNASLSGYAATGSMLPVLNEDSKGIKIPVTSPEQLHAGDIITYRDKSGDLVIHRIMSIGFDEKGTYYIMKGDNNIISDGRIRFEQILYKLVVLVY
ncbi:hypothetical protein J4447_03510 [Candidatus Pacearchaeota archaeon]|nr:hypothetical protein [Candidatus Pacearchaeota archaeon]